MRTQSYQAISDEIAGVLNGLPDGLPPPGAIQRLAEVVRALAIHVEHHERRIDEAAPPPLRCRYTDCAEGHPQAGRGEQITCRTCRQALGLQEIAAASEVRDLQKEISRLQDDIRDRCAAHVRSCAHETELENELHETRYALKTSRAGISHLQDELRDRRAQRDAALAKVAELTTERDAALAKVAELTRWLEWMLAKTGGSPAPDSKGTAPGPAMAITGAALVRAEPDDKDAAQAGAAVLVLPKTPQGGGTDRTHE